MFLTPFAALATSTDVIQTVPLPKEPLSMIGKLKGAIDSVGDDWAIVDVHGVGYQ
ncbi:MAG: OB-fold domain-containing protein, partial [Pseudomonadota bacterium]